MAPQIERNCFYCVFHFPWLQFSRSSHSTAISHLLSKQKGQKATKISYPPVHSLPRSPTWHSDYSFIGLTVAAGHSSCQEREEMISFSCIWPSPQQWDGLAKEEENGYWVVCTSHIILLSTIFSSSDLFRIIRRSVLEVRSKVWKRKVSESII